MFNNFFINIGAELSKDITVPANVSIYGYLENRNKHNLFLTGDKYTCINYRPISLLKKII